MGEFITRKMVKFRGEAVGGSTGRYKYGENTTTIQTPKPPFTLRKRYIISNIQKKKTLLLFSASELFFFHLEKKNIWFSQSPRNPTETTPTYPGVSLFELTRFGLSISKLLRVDAKVEKVTGAWCPLVGNWDHDMTPGPKLHALLYKGKLPSKLPYVVQCLIPSKMGNFMTPG